MGAGKNQYLRWIVIHECLSRKSKQFWSLSELASVLVYKDLGVDKRSIERDLHVMRNDTRLGFNTIRYNRKEKGYYIFHKDVDQDDKAIPV